MSKPSKETNKDKSVKIDGFVRRKKTSSGFKASKRSADLKFTEIDGEIDPQNFPGLKNTFQQPASHADTGIEYDVDDIFSEDSDKPRRRFRNISRWKLIKRIALAATVLVLLIGSWLAIKGVITVRKVFKDDGTTAVALSRDVDPTQLNSEGDGRVNVLILGKGGDNHDGGELTDSMIIASIDPFEKTAALLSIPRDLYVSVPDLWSMKINAAYVTSKQKSLDQGANTEAAERSGITTLRDTIETHMGVPIHYHVMVDFRAFEEAVDALGGIELDIEERLYDTNFLPTLLLDIQPGRQTFNGQTALFYARSRYTSPRGDHDRAERQRAILVAMREKALSLGTFTNPVRISQLLDVIGDNMQTNISLDEMRQLYSLAQDIGSENIVSLSLVDDPILITQSFVGDQSVEIPLAGINNFSDIKSFVRNALLDGFIKKEAATIAVLNGSGIPGHATKRANELESYGYDVVTIDDAPTADYLSTVMYDLSDDQNPYTKRYLERRLGVVVSTKDPDPLIQQYNADFVIIVGANEEINQ